MTTTRRTRDHESSDATRYHGRGEHVIEGSSEARGAGLFAARAYLAGDVVARFPVRFVKAPGPHTAVAAAGTATALRVLALLRGWSLPEWRSGAH